MSYIKHVLQPGETVRYQGSMHWILYLPAIVLSVVGVVTTVFGPPGWVISAICLLVALILALRAWFIRWMTEIVVTDRRVIYVHGFIRRNSIEVHMNQILSKFWRVRTSALESAETRASRLISIKEAPPR